MSQPLFLTSSFIAPKSATKSFAKSPWCYPDGLRGVTKKNSILSLESIDNVRASKTCQGIYGGSSVLSAEEVKNDNHANGDLLHNDGKNVAPIEPSHGLGIIKFLRGKVFFITGATGFLAKVLVEKILRSVPDVDKIYVLIKAESKNAAMQRLKGEIIDADIFKCLKQIHGKSYEAFISSKLVPVVGNICEPNLGTEIGLAEDIADNVDIIINSAANTTFDERYDVALEVNTKGACQLMSFAKTCTKLKLFLHLSTAYVNGQRRGRIVEKPFTVGDSIAMENIISMNSSLPLPVLDVDAEMKLAWDSRAAYDDNTRDLVSKMKELGLKRARSYGWQDTYGFTKAMGEMMINSMRGEVPVVILRPSIVESTFRDPFPGWIEGNRMMDPILLLYGKGLLNSFLADSNGVLDVVPADMVVNATLAAMAKHGAAKKPGMSIYHVASSAINPLVFRELQKLCFIHFSSSPCVNSKGKAITVEKLKFFSSMDDFTTHTWDNLVRGNTQINSTNSHTDFPKRLEIKSEKLMQKIKHLAEIYNPYTFYEGRFDNSNSQKLMGEMSEAEKENFGFDVGSIDWKEYICDIHIPGLRKHVMKETGVSQ